MSSEVTVAIIGGIFVVIAAVITAAKSWFPSSDEDSGKSNLKNITHSNVAIGENVSQHNVVENHTHNYAPNVPSPSHSDYPFPLVASTPDALTVLNELSAAKPFERAQVEQNFCGQTVTWLASLSAVDKRNYSDDSHLIFHPAPNSLFMITVDINIEHYPKLKIVHTGHQIWLHGQISSISPISVTLNPVKLYIT
jgi:hypothetical protein